MLCPKDFFSSCHLIQRYVLAVFYFTTQGYQWKSCSAPKDYACEEEIATANKNCDRKCTPHHESDRIGINETNAWLTPVHECLWGGVACYGERDFPELAYCVDQIDFEDNNLAGNIPNEIASLENLRYLYLERGHMTGTIPSALGKLHDLRVIDLDFNQFSKTIPSDIYGLNHLRQLDLNNNVLSGTLSTEVGKLGNLQVLQIDHNQFEGTIPVEIGQLEQLGTFGFAL